MLHRGVRAIYEHPQVVMLQQHLLGLVGGFHKNSNVAINPGTN